MNLSKKQAKTFLMLYHGLLGVHQYEGIDGALAFVRHVTALQYDPIDVCGKNAELVLCSRVKHFEKSKISPRIYISNRSPAAPVARSAESKSHWSTLE
ncbi:hypothetical protein RFF05_05510 [Bengtsoniella intestinalis]|uniref:hypothetical protein n=1 Tax=Bengtsoniella intestinalis TaxID=3073143 RepID=UPI00391F670D